MTTSDKWLALRQELSRSLAVIREHPRGYLGRTSDGKEVHLEHLEGSAGPWIVLRTPICAQRDLSAAWVLEQNAQLCLAMIVLIQGRYWLRMALPFGADELRDPAQLLADLTLSAQTMLSSGATQESTVDVFHHYT